MRGSAIPQYHHAGASLHLARQEPHHIMVVMATGCDLRVDETGILCDGLISEISASSLHPVVLKGSYDAISSFAFSLECYKLFVHKLDPWSCKD